MFASATTPTPPWGSPHGSGPYSLPLQRLLVQTSVQAKPGHVSPLQLTNISVPQQVRLPHQARPPPGLQSQFLVACSDVLSPVSRT